ncbi:hypothetical protein OLQ90_07375 [Campylobacter jejuni]|nr:hypothetical protein [Campylobacter jejuni]
MIKKIRILFLAIFLAFSPMVLEAKIYDDVYVAQKQALKEAKLMIFFCGFKHLRILSQAYE